MEIRVGAVDLDGLIPEHRLHALTRLPVELDEGALALGVHKAEAVHAEPLHEPVRARDGAVRHLPHDHMQGFRHERDKIPIVVMSRLRLRKTAIRLILDGMNKVRKFHRVLNEEDRDVVADDVPVAFLGIQLDGKAAHIARKVHRTLVTRHGRKPHKGRNAAARLLEQMRGSDLAQCLGRLEIAMRAVATGMDHALRDALMVEMEDLFAHGEIFQQGRAARACAQGILVVGNRRALCGGHPLAIRKLVGFTTLTAALLALNCFIAGLGIGGRAIGRDMVWHEGFPP